MRPCEFLTDEFYFLTHDVQGRLQVGARPFGLGLAATLLGELALSERVLVTDQGVLAAALAQPPAGPVLRRVLTGMLAEPVPLGVSTWLRFLSPRAPTWVRQAMHESGLLVSVSTFSLWRRGGVRLEPCDTPTANLPSARMQWWASGRYEGAMPDRDAFLLGVLDATRLSPTLVWDLPPHRDLYLEQRMAALPDSLMRVLAATRTAVDQSVLAYST